MPNIIVYDLETQKSFDEINSREPSKLGVSVVVVYDYRDNQYKSFQENQLKNIWPLFEQADLIVGYNQKHFDNKVLNAYYAGDMDTFAHLDLLEEFYKTAGFRARLDDLAQATLGEKKSGSGLQALKWFKEGNLEAIEKYCLQDVRVTKNLYEYARQHGHVKYREINEVKVVQFDTSRWDKIMGQTVNYTLPF